MNQHLLNLLRGLAMGCADVVPGVSGGTVALITGIYERLVTALSRFDRHWVGLLARRQWRAAAKHVDLLFLLSLAAGALFGIVLMTLAVNRLLKHEVGRPLLLSAFFGMILASSLLVGAMVRPNGRPQAWRALLAGMAGAVLSLCIARLNTPDPQAVGDPSPLFLFLCGVTGICAMILPGISGAMILLVLGVYAYLTDIPHLLLHGQDVGSCLRTIAIFGSGCAVGLLSFSKLLRWLLGRHRALTMATLCGVMIGALYKIWPFQLDLSPQMEELKYKRFKLVIPTEIDGVVLSAAVVALAAMGLVLLIDRWRRWTAKAHSQAG